MENRKHNNRARLIATISGFVTAIALIVTGLVKNQQAAVLTKAIKICLECVGIG